MTAGDLKTVDVGVSVLASGQWLGYLGGVQLTPPSEVDNDTSDTRPAA